MTSISRALGATVALLILTACQEPNPYYLGPVAEPDIDAAIIDDGAAPGLDAEADASVPDARTVDGGMCTPASCEVNFGPAPCGKWSCAGTACQVLCPMCQDKDRDGFGVGAGCAGPDCDDNEPNVAGDVAARSCYEGAAGTAGKGICRSGVKSCTAGVWTECQGQQLPLVESCNEQDDDCNSKVDDLPPVSCGLGVCATTVDACSAAGLCMPKEAASGVDACGGGDEDCDGLIDEDCQTCVHVTTTGIDAKADGSTLLPFRTLQAAVDWAAANPGRPKLVCVAASLTCSDLAVNQGRFIEPEGKTFTMKNGISVVGGYESTTWSLCPRAAGSVLSRNAPVLITRDADGVLFSEAVTTPTVLAGFVIERPIQVKNSAAITIRGARNAVVANVKVLPVQDADVNVGIDINGKAEAIVSHCDINVGAGAVRAAAVNVKGSAVAIVDNCDAFDASGRCKATCASELPALRAGTGESKGDVRAVVLDGATLALLRNNALCTTGGTNSAGVKVEGASGSIAMAGNVVRAAGVETNAAAVWLTSCGGARPWIVNNTSLTALATGGSNLAAVLSTGDCHPRIEDNLLINTTGSQGKGSVGVSCGVEAGKASACHIARNLQIRSGTSEAAETAAAIRCEANACAVVQDNALIDGGRAKRTYGLWLEGGSARVAGNLISGGCGSVASTGIVAADSGSRIDNNVIFGATCSTSSVVQPTGVSLLIGDARRAVDLHSNTIDTAEGTGSCTGATMTIASRADTTGGVAGTIRNNIFSHHVCRGTLVEERDAKAHARVLEFNLFDRAMDLPAFLADGKDLLSVSDLNKNTASSVRRNNISGDPKFVGWPNDVHLEDGSSAIDKGTSTGAPLWDRDGQKRDDKPDIGAYEHH
ncbi:MAG: choice-of-anchor Q domain-containing protein [Deltaproteobacteria bacterium]|nr:choice-of-anchor Q domain-containing protein [Deltaproteobacteria bacterium]